MKEKEENEKRERVIEVATKCLYLYFDLLNSIRFQMKFIFRASVRFAYQFTNKRGRTGRRRKRGRGRRGGELVALPM